MMVTVIRACVFLWNYGIITGYNKGYSPEEFVVEEEAQLNDDIAASEQGKIVCDIVANYLWKQVEELEETAQNGKTLCRMVLNFLLIFLPGDIR